MLLYFCNVEGCTFIRHVNFFREKKGKQNFINSSSPLARKPWCVSWANILIYYATCGTALEVLKIRTMHP